MKYLTLIIFLLLSTGSVVSGSDKNVWPVDGHSFCLPHSEFNIGGIEQGFGTEKVIAIKGKPLELISYDIERVERLVYPDMTLGIVNEDHIYELTTTSPKNKTPSGIAVGMSRDDVMKIIGYKNYSEEQLNFSFINCDPAFFGYYFRLKFDENYILKEMGWGADLP